jgi:hypothetical protein
MVNHECAPSSRYSPQPPKPYFLCVHCCVQANYGAMQRCLSAVAAATPPRSSVLELYAGSGVIGLSLAAAGAARKVVCVEVNPLAKQPFDASLAKLAATDKVGMAVWSPPLGGGGVHGAAGRGGGGVHLQQQEQRARWYVWRLTQLQSNRLMQAWLSWLPVTRCEAAPPGSVGGMQHALHLLT